MKQYITPFFLLIASFLFLFWSIGFTEESWTSELDAFLDELLADDDSLYDEGEPKNNKEDTKKEEAKDSTWKEICDNEIDDNGNWLIDCDDTLCAKEKICENHESAEEILDQMDDDKRTYISDKAIKIKNIKETSADLITTIAQFDKKNVEKYRAYYSEKSLSTQKLDLIKDIAITATAIKGDKDNISLTLNKLKPETKYYVVVSPIHPTDATNEPLTMVTDEVSFTTKSNTPPPAEKEEEKEEVKKEDPKTDTKAKDPAPTPAPEAWPWPNEKVFSNVTYTNSNNTINLVRDGSMKWVDKAEIHLRHQWESSYSNIGSPSFTSWKFTFNVDKSGNYFLKMKGLDKTGKAAWREHIQTVKVTTVTAPTNNPVPVVTNPPKVWPTTDIMIGLIALGIIFYMMYRFRRTR